MDAFRWWLVVAGAGRAGTFVTRSSNYLRMSFRAVTFLFVYMERNDLELYAPSHLIRYTLSRVLAGTQGI